MKFPEEVEELRNFRDHLARSIFVGGIAPTVSSRVLQEHLQQFAYVQLCALLTGTRNDRSKAAKVTLTTREGGNRAMAADYSSLDGRMIRVRLWACRPKERPKERAFQRASYRHEGEPLFPAPPPGLESTGGDEPTETLSEEDAWVGTLAAAEEAFCPSLNAITEGRETEERTNQGHNKGIEETGVQHEEEEAEMSMKQETGEQEIRQRDRKASHKKQRKERKRKG
jgi:hypothetical protein